MRTDTVPEPGAAARASTSTTWSGSGTVDALAIFGATGDLARIETFPALYRRGSWGPPEADALLPAGDTWHDPT
jgi:glucose-6-phosphate 1-dehydrogenase